MFWPPGGPDGGAARSAAFYYSNLIFLFKQDVHYCGHVGNAGLSVFVHVAALVACLVEQEVRQRCDVGNAHLAVAVHVALEIRLADSEFPPESVHGTNVSPRLINDEVVGTRGHLVRLAHSDGGVVACAEVAAVPVGERPVAADVETADASALGASEEGGVEARSVPPGGSLVAVRRSSEGRSQLLRVRTREASNPVFVLDDEREDQSWDELRECAEATVGSLRSSLEVFCRDVPKILQVTVSGIPFLFCDRGVLRDAPLPSLRI